MVDKLLGNNGKKADCALSPNQYCLLSGAAEGGHVNILKNLVKRWADITIKNKKGVSGETILHTAD